MREDMHDACDASGLMLCAARASVAEARAAGGRGDRRHRRPPHWRGRTRSVRFY